MSLAYDKGKSFENEIARLINRKLKTKLFRDNRSGSGTVRQDIYDWHSELPLSLELKNQKTVKIGEWFRQSVAASSIGQIPTVVFNTDEEILACLRFDDLLNLLKEIRDYKKEIESLRAPTTVIDKADLKELSLMPDKTFDLGYTVKRSHLECRGGHLSDEWGYCSIKDCKYRRGYRAPKSKK